MGIGRLGDLLELNKGTSHHAAVGLLQDVHIHHLSMFGEEVLQSVLICFEAQVPHNKSRLILGNTGSSLLFCWLFCVPVLLVGLHSQFQRISSKFKVFSFSCSFAVPAHSKGDKTKVAFLALLRFEDETFLDRTELRENILKLPPRRLQGQVGHLNCAPALHHPCGMGVPLLSSLLRSVIKLYS